VAHPASSTPAFDFQKILGRAGMGVVYLVKDRRLHRLVALKLLRNMGPEVASSGARSRLLAALEHECIVRLYEFGSPATTPTCLMEYVPGVTLATRVSWEHRASSKPLRIATDISPRAAGSAPARHRSS